MKICAKCQKMYDDSWKVCLQCRGELRDTVAGTVDKGDIAQLRNELADIKSKVDRLEGWLNALSDKLTFGQKASEPARPQPVEEHVKKESPQAAFEPPWKVKEAPKARRTLSENFEQILGEQWFNKLGILAVVVGMALLIGYSFRYLGPVGKISIGYAVGLGLILFGNHLEKKDGFSVYGRSLIGGGWALNYFTAFAMHHIPDVRLVESPVVGMFIMLGVSIAAVSHIYRYRSQTATAFSYLLIFITLMATPMSPYTLVAALIAAVSLIFFMYKLGWNALGVYGMVMSYITFMSLGKPPATDREFFVGMSFLMLYWAIFVVASLIMKKSPANGANDLGGKVELKEASFIINAFFACFIAGGMMQAGFMKYLQPVLALGSGLYLLLTVITYLIKQKSLCMVGSTFSVILALALLTERFHGYSATVSYILLAQLVLLAGIILKEAYWRILSFLLLVIILGKLLVFDAFLIAPAASVGPISKRTLLFGVAFIFYLLNHILYSRLKDSSQITREEVNFPTILSYTFPAIYAMGTWLDLPKVLTAPCWAVLGVILLQFGVSRKNFNQRLQGYILAIGAFSRLFMSNMMIPGGISIFSYRILTVIPVLLILYYCLTLLRDEEAVAGLIEKEKDIPSLFTYMIFAGIMFLARYEAGKDLVASVWSLISVAYLVRGISSKRPQHLIACSIAAISACIRGVFVNTLQTEYLVGIQSNIVYAGVATGILYAGNIIHTKANDILDSVGTDMGGRVKTFLCSPRFVLGLAATILLTAILMARLKDAVLTVGLGTEGLLLFLCGFGLKERNWRIYGLIILMLTLLKTFLIDLRQLGTLYYILSLIGLGAVLLFVSYIYTKYKDKIKKLI